MGVVRLCDFKGNNDCELFSKACEYMKAHPGTVLSLEPRVYRVSGERARAAQKSVMNGEYGKNPQNVMFSPEYEYDRAIDLDGHVNTVIEGNGALIIAEGFLEDVSVRNCSGVTVRNLSFDLERRAYSRGTVLSVSEDGLRIRTEFAKEYPITPRIPFMRACVYDSEKKRLDGRIYPCDMEYEDEFHAVFTLASPSVYGEGTPIYLWHTYHSRPCILIENAKDVLIEDVTVFSHPGMGITAQNSEDITLRRYRNIPPDGEWMSTNTDAAHFACCRGKLLLEDCEFRGQGDDSINVHSYYFDILSVSGRTMRIKASPPDGTHAQTPVFPRAGDTLEVTGKSDLYPCESFKAVSVSCDPVTGEAEVTSDREIKASPESCCIADADAVPELVLSGCSMTDHFARGAVIKCRSALIENCVMRDVFETGLKIAPEASWKEGVNTRDVTVRNCIFENCGHYNRACGGIYMYMECDVRDKNVHERLTVENCVIKCPEAKHAVIVCGTKEVLLSGNSLCSDEEPVLTDPSVKLL